MSDDPDDPEWTKLGAKHEAEFLISVRDKSVDQTMAMGRWLLASLLVVNGGGALATLDAADKLTNAGLPGGLFVAGIMFALLSGVAIQWPILGSLKPINEVIGYWHSVVHDGERVESMEAKHRELGAAIMLRGHISAIPGWLSALLFLAGAVAVGYSFPSTSPTSADSPAESIPRH